mgnify:CR=1 FL=1
MADQKGRGTRAENAVADELGALGYDVIRSAASKGAADLVAVHDGEILFVQVKLRPPDKPIAMPTPTERRELFLIAERCGGIAVCAFRIPGAGRRPAETHYRVLTGHGAKQWDDWDPAGDAP